MNRKLTTEEVFGELTIAVNELQAVTTDRDIKAANLKTLVDMVLDYKEARDSAVGGPDHIDTYEAERLFDEVVALARGLKQ